MRLVEFENIGLSLLELTKEIRILWGILCCFEVNERVGAQLRIQVEITGARVARAQAYDLVGAVRFEILIGL